MTLMARRRKRSYSKGFICVQTLSPTVSLISPISIHGDETAWASREGLDEGDRKTAADGGDGERDVAFRPDGRRRGAGNPWVAQACQSVRGRSGAEGEKGSARP